jgi:hypothetical protein
MKKALTVLATAAGIAVAAMIATNPSPSGNLPLAWLVVRLAE